MPADTGPALLRLAAPEVTNTMTSGGQMGDTRQTDVHEGFIATWQRQSPVSKQPVV